MIHADWLRARAQATPNKLALLIGDASWSYKALDSLVDEECRHLRQLNIRPADHVAILMPTANLRYVCRIHALARLGAVIVPLNSRLTPTELNWQMKKADVCILLGDGQQKRVKDRQTPSPNHTPALHSILFTSGTTSQPKGVMLTRENHFWSATTSTFRLGIAPDDIWLSCLPLYHVGGLAILLRACLYGIAVDLHPRFDTKLISKRLDKHPISLISLVPTMVYRLLAYRGGRDWGKELRHLLVGGAALPAQLAQQCHTLNIPVSTTYGMTETASQIATQLPAETQQKPGSVGKPLLFSSVQIANPDEAGIGEIIVRSPSVMAGYYNNPEATAGALQDGALHTGDLGYLDEDGDLWMVQRRTDLIITGGENVYPAEVEAVLRQHPDVAVACVVGVSHPEWGQQVAAMVQLAENAGITTDELRNFCRQYLAGYKVPKRVVFVPAVPQTASGKIHRQAVQESLTRH